MQQFFRNIWEILEMIKIGHSVLALPFAFMGAMLAARGWPDGRTTLFILLAMVAARSAAMAFNRLADARFDALNPRTASRSLPQGRLKESAVLIFVIVNSGIFIWAAGQLNQVCLLLSPLALVVILGYSLTKRFTSATHFILGLGLGLAPVGGWLAVRGDLSFQVLVLGASVLFWVAGFDILYALQDEEFDRQTGLWSLPVRVGSFRARSLAAGCHLLAAAGFFLTGRMAGLHGVYPVAALLGAGLLAGQHIILVLRGATRLPPAFFTLNGLIGVGLGLATWLSLIS
ncbi:MAG: UbiA family prenyltransferase [Deltaproteobacteria bacterium]|nr:UbiA family prenyltransferase [Deltaproteobacteria bacterium]